MRHGGVHDGDLLSSAHLSGGQGYAVGRPTRLLLGPVRPVLVCSEAPGRAGLTRAWHRTKLQPVVPPQGAASSGTPLAAQGGQQPRRTSLYSNFPQYPGSRDEEQADHTLRIPQGARRPSCASAASSLPGPFPAQGEERRRGEASAEVLDTWLSSGPSVRDESFNGWLVPAARQREDNPFARVFLFSALIASAVLLGQALIRRQDFRPLFPAPSVSLLQRQSTQVEGSDASEASEVGAGDSAEEAGAVVKEDQAEGEEGEAEAAEKAHDAQSGAEVERIAPKEGSAGDEADKAAPLRGRVVVPPYVDPAHQQLLKALQTLQVIEADVNPGGICTRGDFARWLLAYSHKINRSPALRVAPAMFIDGYSQALFDDVGPNSPDFAAVQGLAEAGIIDSQAAELPAFVDGEVEQNSPSPSPVVFKPGRPLTRQDAISWKFNLEHPFVEPMSPTMQESLLRGRGLLDAQAVSKEAKAALVFDLVPTMQTAERGAGGKDAGDSSLVASVFGYTRRFDPLKPVTNAQAAACLAFGDTLERVQGVFGSVELEASRKEVEAAKAEAAAAQRAFMELEKELVRRKEENEAALEALQKQDREKGSRRAAAAEETGAEEGGLRDGRAGRQLKLISGVESGRNDAAGKEAEAETKHSSQVAGEESSSAVHGGAASQQKGGVPVAHRHTGVGETAEQHGTVDRADDGMGGTPSGWDPEASPEGGSQEAEGLDGEDEWRAEGVPEDWLWNTVREKWARRAQPKLESAKEAAAKGAASLRVIVSERFRGGYEAVYPWLTARNHDAGNVIKSHIPQEVLQGAQFAADGVLKLLHQFVQAILASVVYFFHLLRAILPTARTSVVAIPWQLQHAVTRLASRWAQLVHNSANS